MIAVEGFRRLLQDLRKAAHLEDVTILSFSQSFLRLLRLVKVERAKHIFPPSITDPLMILGLRGGGPKDQEEREARHQADRVAITEMRASYETIKNAIPAKERIPRDGITVRCVKVAVRQLTGRLMNEKQAQFMIRLYARQATGGKSYLDWHSFRTMVKNLNNLFHTPPESVLVEEEEEKDDEEHETNKDKDQERKDQEGWSEGKGGKAAPGRKRRGFGGSAVVAERKRKEEEEERARIDAEAAAASVEAKRKRVIAKAALEEPPGVMDVAIGVTGERKKEAGRRGRKRDKNGNPRESMLYM
jgi:hypothetical protein